MSDNTLSNRIDSISTNIRNCSVAILGDVCLDQYSFIDSSISEISAETGLKTISIKSEKLRLGGASNVALSCKILGIPKVDIYGVVGNDYQANIIRDKFRNNQIGIEGLITQDKHWNTHVYHKIVQVRKEINRYDLGNFNHPSKKTADIILTKLNENISKYQCVIINEQVMNGIHNEYFISKLNEIIKNNSESIIWIVDTRHLLGRYENVIYKFNKIEAATYCSHICEKEQSTVEYGKLLSTRWKMPVIITCGEDGAIVCTSKSTHIIDGIDFFQEIDPVGAGDAFLAGTAAAILSGEDIKNAAEIGNLTAAVSVLTLFETGHPTLEELKVHSQNLLWRHNAHLAKSFPRYLPETQIEIIDPSFTLGRALPKIAIFDHDGTISTFRQGWESVMQQVMMQYLIGDAEISVQERTNLELKVKDLIDKSTGIQTITQMKYFVEMVNKEGLVPSIEILSAENYKKIYLDELMKTMEHKFKALKNEELNVEDFTIKASVKFLERLYENGTILYMASGTDRDDVRNEANILGYSKLFEGRIFGSVGNDEEDPKKLVMQQIIHDIEKSGYSPEECAVFGDGPVEMREGSKYGFETIGIVSDEKQRFGINPTKRARLILAGAHVLIPDFSQISSIYPEE
ncbi:MAG: PfkB family carbohydrate kinase [Sphaerochaetaceae bacterium]|nr:PfkB family carbohydrate kinase [Sphaerochaetaceae bacterium]